MSHAPHDPATGSFLYDDCPECDARAAEPLMALQHLDGVQIARAWRAMRAVKWSNPAETWELPLSFNDRTMLSHLYGIAVLLQRAGIEPEEIERRALTAHLENVAKLADVLTVDVPQDVLVRAVQLGAVPGMSEHPHAGRIAAAAHLSAALALVECARVALDEDGISYSDDDLMDVTGALNTAADTIMRPCEIANVLQTVEEMMATGVSSEVGRALLAASHEIGAYSSSQRRERLVRAIVDARQAAKDDETRACCDSLRAGPHAPDCKIYNAETEDREPTDDELANRHGVEGGIGYRTEPIMEELLREKGDL